MIKPKICAVLVRNDPKSVNEIEELIDLYEVRIDLIGKTWTKLVDGLHKPWIATNRSPDEGGKKRGTEEERIEDLLRAVKLGAEIVDIELNMVDLKQVISDIKGNAKILISFHDLKMTPDYESVKEIVQREIKAGADICKVVTTARRFEDNFTVLRLLSEFKQTKLVTFAMGPLGTMSRVMCPLVGGEFTYASVKEGRESSPGQLTVKELIKTYEMVNK
jgi:3-dehydroquinate dehydratase I